MRYKHAPSIESCIDCIDRILSNTAPSTFKIKFQSFHQGVEGWRDGIFVISFNTIALIFCITDFVKWLLNVHIYGIYETFKIAIFQCCYRLSVLFSFAFFSDNRTFLAELYLKYMIAFVLANTSFFSLNSFVFYLDYNVRNYIEYWSAFKIIILKAS